MVFMALGYFGGGLDKNELRAPRFQQANTPFLQDNKRLESAYGSDDGEQEGGDDRPE